MEKNKNKALFSVLMFSTLLTGACPEVFASTNEAMAVLQVGTVKGQVTDEKGEPIIGASVKVKGEAGGVITDMNGNFSLKGAKGSLLISYIGYKPLEVTVKGADLGRIVLTEDSKSLNELVVIGYGSVKKESLTGSVAVVNSDQFKDRGNMSNPLQALQGQVPGLRITRNSSDPSDERWNVSIRGAVSKNSTGPLVIIDGVPTDGTEALKLLNPSDIESINFLKDASAAIYGSKAAGGVMLITTKHPVAGKAKIEYSGSFTRKFVGLQPHLMSYDVWTDAIIQAVKNDPESTTDAWVQYATLAKALKGQYLDLTSGKNPVEPMPGYFSGVPDLVFADVDWNKVLWGGANATQHDLSISGGTERSSYRLSLGYIYSGSTLKWGNNYNRRYNVRLSNNFKITDRFNISSVIAGSRQNLVSPTMVSSAISSMPLHAGFPASTIDGKPYQWGSEYASNWLAELGGDNKLLVTDVSINETLTYDFMKDLRLTATLGYATNDAVRDETYNSIQWYSYNGTKLSTNTSPYPSANESSYTYSTQKTDTYTASAYLTYSHNWNSLHDFSAMLGTQYDRKNFQSASTKAKNIQPSLEILNGTGEVTIKSADKYEEALLSYFSRINYSYKNKYLLEGNARYDGSSKFQPENRWSFFYGFSGGWRIMEERFMAPLKDIVNELKLKVSYGQIGNQSGISRYDGIQFYNYSSNGGAYIGDGRISYVSAGALISKDRTWERIHNYNIGLEFALLNSRLSGSIDFYKRRNNNMLIAQLYPGTLGGTAPSVNTGKFRSNGYEGTLNWRDHIGDFSYHVGGTLTFMENTLVSGGTDVISAGFNSAVNGYPLNSVFGYQYVGKIQTEEQLKKYKDRFLNSNTVDMPSVIRLGDNMYQDVNGDGKLTQDDLVYLGTDDPKLSYSFNLGFEWKGIDFSVDFQGVAQRTVFSSDLAYRIPFKTVYRNTSDYTWGNTWSPETPDNRYPAYTTNTKINNYNYMASSWSVENGSYLRLKNIVLGYTLPASVYKKLNNFITNLRLYVSGADLWEISKIRAGWDPEATRTVSSGSQRYPFNRTLTVGLNVTF